MCSSDLKRLTGGLLFGSSGVSGRSPPVAGRYPRCEMICGSSVEFVVSPVLARRAAGRSPRREPWEQEHSHGPALEGRHNRVTLHAAFASDTTTVSPFQGFQAFLSDAPTAHAVGYDLPSSGLKTETLRTLSSEETDFCRNGRPIFSDLPETPDEHVATTATRRELGTA